MTPLAGLVMGTRTGDIDPAVALHLQRQAGMSAEEVDALFNKSSGMKGLCGANDLREIHAARQPATSLRRWRWTSTPVAYASTSGPIWWISAAPTRSSSRPVSVRTTRRCAR